MTADPSEQCIFCRIARGEVPAEVVYQDEECLGFRDAHPKAPVHILVIPRQHIPSVNELTPENEPLMGHLVWVAAQIARQMGIDQNGYRLMINTGEEGGQSVFHIHLHLLGGKHQGRY